jgi:hypothetical protein
MENSVSVKLFLKPFRVSPMNYATTEAFDALFHNHGNLSVLFVFFNHEPYNLYVARNIHDQAESHME